MSQKEERISFNRVNKNDSDGGMSEKKIKTVGELKRALEYVDEDIPVKLMVNYDNCGHIQEMGSIYVFHNGYTDTDEWCTLIGAKNGDVE